MSIDAPAKTVWHAMLDSDSYREWTSAFHQGSYFVGDWDLGSEIRFLGPADEGEGEGGLIGHIVESRPEEYVSIEYDGQVIDGVDDTTSDVARSFRGMRESYDFREQNGVTTVTVEMDVDAEMAEMMKSTWPAALDNLAAIAERPASDPAAGRGVS